MDNRTKKLLKEIERLIENMPMGWDDPDEYDQGSFDACFLQGGLIMERIRDYLKEVKSE